MLFRLVHLLMIVSLAWAGPVLAKGEGRGGGDAMGGGTGGAGLSSKTTKRVVKALTRGFDACQGVRVVFRYDCYRQTYKLAADQISGNPSYRDALKALAGVETTLKRIMKENADPTTRPIRHRFQVLRPIKPAAVPAAKAELTRSLEEAKTTLLRSSDNAGIHYQRIAEAIDSNKVLLRSTLLAPILRLLRTAFVYGVLRFV